MRVSTAQWLPVVIVVGLIATVLTNCDNQSERGPAFHTGCISNSQGSALCMTSDMAKVSRTGSIPFEHEQYNLNDGRVRLTAARNETVAFQLIIRNNEPDRQTINLSLDAFRRVVDESSPESTTVSVSGTRPPVQDWFAAHYHYVDDGGYTWGPKSPVLPWPNEYPDALVPQRHTCAGLDTSLFDDIKTGVTGSNQALWIDNWFPPDLAPGLYEQTVSVQSGETTYSFTLEFDVLPVTLPAEPSLHAVGELYRTYRMEGVTEDWHQPNWKSMAHCYQQLAHQHRMVFIERTPESLNETSLARYIDIYQPVLDGTLFTEQYGYQGTGSNTPVGVWRTPWSQDFSGRQDALLDPVYYAQLQRMASEWDSLVTQQQWQNTEYFAYLFDEVEGEQEDSESDVSRYQYLASIHAQIEATQQALDSNSTTPIDLIWTSHSDPAQWSDDPALDLSGRIRLWAPNAHAANVEFLTNRIQQGDKAWFYHSGHPAVGVHSVNASGIEMRTWGVIAARYGFQGQMMWAVNLGNDDAPFADPSYKVDDDRFGNGVMVYPGNQLPRIGYPASPGPIPSMRLKAWRRGLQDAELYYLARQADNEAADQLINTIVPTALTDGSGAASWSDQAADWIAFRQALLSIIVP